jgi:hypothetical protein
MKPVIKEQTRYNILFMRDDGKARTFRLRRGVLRFFIWFLVLLVLLSGGVIAAGSYFGAHYLSLLDKTEQQEREISEMRLQLERLTNLESLISASPSEAIPLAKHEEVGVAAPVNRTQNATTPAGEVPPATANGASGMSIGMSAETQQNGTGGGGNQSIAGPASPVHIQGFSGRPIGQQRLRIRYDLAVADRLGSRVVSGMVRHFAVFNDGRTVELALADNADSRFSINKGKSIEVSTRLPDGYDTKDIRQIQLVLSTEDFGSFHDFYDVAQWRAN